jgi:hypothetical protein
VRIFLLISFSFVVLTVFGQEEEEKQKIIEARIEFIGDNLEDSDIDLTTYFDDLYFFFDNPVNLNKTDYDELKRLHLFSDIQIQAILNYLSMHGNMITIFELNAVETVDMETIQMALPFLTVGEGEQKKFKWSNAFKYGKQEIFLRYQRDLVQKAGYKEVDDSTLAANPNKQYLGSPDKYYLRYRNTYKDRISWGLTAEKDAGEEFFRGNNKAGFDYYSAHLFFKDLWKFKQVALGDFQVNFGQGLTMWSGFGMGKSADIFSGRRFAYGLKPYTSVNETQFLRGAGVTAGFGEKVDVTVFGSYKKIDGNLNEVDSTDLFDNSFSSFQISGLHRTVNEMSNKQGVGQLITGGEVSYKAKTFRLGLASVYTKYDQPLDPNQQPYQAYKFSGDELLTSGLNYRWFIRKLSFFGEASVSDNMRLGTVNGVTWHADPKLDLVAIFRSYDKGFQSLYSVGFGESSDNTSEMGLYIGLQARLSKRISVSAYYDQFKYTYLKWLTDDRSEGREFFAQMDFKVNRRSSFQIRIRNKIQDRNTRDEVTGIDGQVQLNKTNFRINYDQRINSQISLKSRIEWTRYLYDDDKSNGILLFQDIVYRFKKVPLKIYSRLAIFDAESYDARIYAYENDLLYVFSIPSYYNRGMRTYLMAKYKIGRSIDIWARFGLWSYDNVETISSGLEEIEGSRKMDFKLQMKIRL